MLTISSIAVAPSPQSVPVVRAQPVTPAKPGQAVARDSAAPQQVAPQGEAARVQAVTPSPLAPVPPVQEAQPGEGQTNATVPQRSGLPPEVMREPGPRERAQANERAAQQARSDRTQAEQAARRAEERRAQQQADAEVNARATDRADEGFPPVKNPALEALETQIKELLPNLWKASRTAVDMMIGEEARQAAAERAKWLEELHNHLNARPLAALPPGEPQQTYGAAASDSGRGDANGRQIDRLV